MEANMGKRISVIVPCYNSEKYLDICFQSLIEQTIGKEYIEIILVNDASTDNTWDMICDYKVRYPDNVITVNLNENIKQGGARNAGILRATGEYITFCDSDDWLELNSFEEVYKILKEYDIDMLQHDHYNVVNGEKHLVRKGDIKGLIELNSVEDRTFFILKMQLTTGQCGKFIRRSIVIDNNIKFAEKTAYEEPKFIFPIFFYGTRFYNMDKAFWNVRIHSESTMYNYVKKDDRILEHAKVQMELLLDMIKREEVVYEYINIIEYYFILTYFIETSYFYIDMGREIQYNDFEKLRNVTLDTFPQYRENPILAEMPQFLELVSFGLEADTIEKSHEFTQELIKYVNASK